MLLADRVRDYSASALHATDIDALFVALERRARADMPGCRLERSADMRYTGQSYELNVPYSAKAFHAEHHKVYGYSDMDRAVEVVTVRVKATIKVKKPAITKATSTALATESARKVRIGGKWVRTPVHDRASVSSKTATGPALILDYGATTLIPASWRFQVDVAGNLICKA